MQKSIVNSYRLYNLKYFEKYGQRKNYPAKFMIECGGMPTEYVYLILSGRIRRYFINNKGMEKNLLLLSKGDMFGEISALQKDIDPVATQSLTNVSLCKIPVTYYEEALKQHANLSFCTTLMLTYKMQILMSQIQDASFCNAEERLKNLLIRLSIQQGISTPNGIRLPIKYTHEELANMISSTRSTVSRIMKRLVQDDFIRIINRYIYFPDT